MERRKETEKRGHRKAGVWACCSCPHRPALIPESPGGQRGSSREETTCWSGCHRGMARRGRGRGEGSRLWELLGHVDEVMCRPHVCLHGTEFTAGQGCFSFAPRPPHAPSCQPSPGGSQSLQVGCSPAAFPTHLRSSQKASYVSTCVSHSQGLCDHQTPAAPGKELRGGADSSPGRKLQKPAVALSESQFPPRAEAVSDAVPSHPQWPEQVRKLLSLQLLKRRWACSI